MTLISVMENDWMTLQYEDQDRYIHHTVLKPVSGEPLRVVLNLGAEWLAKNQATKWLSDDRKNHALPEEDIIYGLQDWGPRAAAVGWKHWALVVPEGTEGRAAMQDLVAAYWDMGVKVAVFTQLEEAREWLKSR